MSDLDAARADIIAAIEGECAAYFAKDFELLASYWVHEDYVRRWVWHADIGMTYFAGWEQDSRATREALRKFPEPMVNDVRRDWKHFIVSGDLAWVIFDQYSQTTGDPLQVTGLQHEMRILQRQNGRWLTACVSNLKPRSEVATFPLIQVDAKGKVITANSFATRRLPGHPGLMISAGRLRARNRAADRALQAAFVWAAGATGYGKRVFLRASSMGGAVPVLEEGPGEAPVILCWVTPADGMILVTFDDHVVAERQTEAAGRVFRLSRGQVQLAKLLMSGHDLATAATALSISINTARTQLQRTFDKTGVHTQSALIRVLLSIVPPLG
jgi:DNA-binding CsgD family transcriptional regulator